MAFKLGQNIGKQIRDIRGDVEKNTSDKVSPHARKAHWHVYWSGPKNKFQKFHYKWFAPIVAGVEK